MFAFTDIGNGVSTRIVDVYAIAPRDGMNSTKFDIPDDIAGKDYSVRDRAGQQIRSIQDVTVSKREY